MNRKTAKRLRRAATHIADFHKVNRDGVYKRLKKDYLALPWKERAAFKGTLPG